MFSAGRVLLMPKGAYNPLTTYEMLDIVSYNGSSYIAKGTTTGNLPTDTTYWQLSAYGGQAANMAGNFAELESSSVATAIHYVDDIFVDENSQLMKATQTINIGDTIDANVNCAPTTVEALIAYLSSYVDSLDSLNKKIQGAIEIAVQTDLHSLAIGEYYKKQTTFYVTNAPTGINQEASATFRLTVEAALDNASQASSPLLLTLRTPDGVVYTQGFDGSAWGSWVEVASAASVSALNTAKQPKTLDTPITVGGVQQTTVEGALGSINQTLTNEVDAIVNVYGSKNVAPNTATSDASLNGVAVTVNPDKSIKLNGTASAGTAIFVCRYITPVTGRYIVSIKNGNNNGSQVIVKKYSSGADIGSLATLSSGGSQAEFNVDYSDYDSIGITIWLPNGTVCDNWTIYPMIRDARIIDGTYEPYVMTNRDLTNNLADEAKTRSIMGAKNILEINVTPSGASPTFTVNIDKSITINGTASEDKYIPISTKEYPFNSSFSISKSTGELTNGNYTLSGNIPVDDMLLGYSVDNHLTWIFVKGGVTYNNVTIYPMIRPATDSNADYEPYAMTNQELTPIASQVDTNTSAIQTINNKIANAGGAYLYWDADNSCAPITDGHYPNNGYVTLGRDSITGTYYLMRYEQSKQGFMIDVILPSGGTAPNDGDMITLGYITES